VFTMKLHLPCILGIVAVAPSACDGPRQCIDAPSNLAPDVVAQCEPPPEGAVMEDQIVSAGAETERDGTLVITWCLGDPRVVHKRLERVRHRPSSEIYAPRTTQHAKWARCTPGEFRGSFALGT